MPSNVVLRVGCRKVGGLGTAFLTIFLAVAFAIVLALAGCSGLVSSNSPSSNPPPPPISLSISTTSLPNGQANAAWSGTLTASGGTTPYTWSLASGSSLPSWLNLNASSGLLNGTPSAAGTVSFTLKVTDSSSTPQTATKSYSFSIAAAGPTPVSITTASLPNGQVGTAWSATLTASGGTTPYTWAASGSSLPSWLTLNASTGQLNGTPSAAGIVSFTLKVTDSSSTPQTASKSYSFSIAAAGPTPVSITTASLPNGQVGTAWLATLAASGGTTPYTWSLASGSSLPSWLTLNASTGQLSGTPSATGTVS
ncbi:MAG TPA: putative Ig domain-containing protein, partial [Candidatus Sulfotelmatobacter sp.]|nr:putative Ig domain-containing protein [Candidatus Sulfotelmatobacter sp.]